MSSNTHSKVWLSITILVIGAIAMMMFVGSPDSSDSRGLTAEDNEQAKEIGKEISSLMGQVSINPENCSAALTQVPALLEKINPLTEKMIVLDADQVDSPEARAIFDLSSGVQWLQEYCPKL